MGRVSLHYILPAARLRKFINEVPFVEAARWIVTGYFFKLFVANNLNTLTTNMDYPLYHALRSSDRWLCLFLYSYQIYADFFGYSAIAIGLGLLFGYRLPINFNLPYISQSFAEFWTRWHISLSTWLRTYLYIPLGGNRHGRGRTYLNLMIVMGLGGLWHGAGLSYLAWGLMHGLFDRASIPAPDRKTCIDCRSASRDCCGSHACCFLMRLLLMGFLQAPEFRACDGLHFWDVC
ncbi:MBOAT family O-acyltransferase [Leptospira interrogans]